MNPNAAIPSFPLEPGTTLALTQPWLTKKVDELSPAVDVMTDLTQVKAASTSPFTTLRQAEQMMIYLGVRMLFVVSDMPEVEGLVTTTDIHGERQMRLVEERRLSYTELCVADVMTSLAMLDAIDFEQIRTASVGNVIATLTRLGRNHLLVVERDADDASRRVRGIFSRTQIERQTGTMIPIVPIAHSFAEIERALV